MKRLPFCLLLAACAGGQSQVHLSSADWEDDHGKSIEVVRQKLGTTKAIPNADVAVGVGGNSDKLIGVALGTGNKWAFSHAIEDRPVVSGNVVVSQGGGELFALDALTGKKLWARPSTGFSMRGAGDDGKYTAVTLEQSGGKGSTLLAIDRQGSVIQRVETDKSLGTPAVIEGHAFVPWGAQYLSVYNIESGDEVARVVVRGKVSRAFTAGGGLYFGEVELFRFDDKTKLASTNGATKIAVPSRELPASPTLMRPGDERTSPVALAVDKTRIYVRPASPEGAPTLDSSRFYATYFRLAMGFDSAHKGAMAWVHSHPVDIVGGAAATGAFVLCDEQGQITILDATSGATTGEQSLGEPVKSCVVSADALAKGTPKTPAPPLALQLSAALLNNDPEMVAGQRLILREIATLEDETITKTLIDLASDPRTPPLLVTDARGAITARRNGAQFMLAALDHHYDFLKDVLRSPPVGPIAQALAAMQKKSAAPLLATHLLDPADSDDDVKQTAAALAILGDASVLPTLKEFFGLYRASADNDELVQAAASAGDALLKFGGPEGRKIVDAALADSMTNDVVKTQLFQTEQLFANEKSAEKDKSKTK